MFRTQILYATILLSAIGYHEKGPFPALIRFGYHKYLAKIVSTSNWSLARRNRVENQTPIFSCIIFFL